MKVNRRIIFDGENDWLKRADKEVCEICDEDIIDKEKSDKSKALNAEIFMPYSVDVPTSPIERMKEIIFSKKENGGIICVFGKNSSNVYDNIKPQLNLNRFQDIGLIDFCDYDEDNKITRKDVFEEIIICLTTNFERYMEEYRYQNGNRVGLMSFRSFLNRLLPYWHNARWEQISTKGICQLLNEYWYETRQIDYNIEKLSETIDAREKSVIPVKIPLHAFTKEFFDSISEIKSKKTIFVIICDEEIININRAINNHGFDYGIGAPYDFLVKYNDINRIFFMR